MATSLDLSFYVLTVKGEEVGSTGQFPSNLSAEDHALLLTVDSRQLVSIPVERIPYYRRKLDKLVRLGYLKKSFDTAEEIAETLPRPFSSFMGTYVKIARGKPTSDKEIEDLRRRLASGIEKSYGLWIGDWTREPSSTPKEVLLELRSAETKKEKIIAIDRAMGFEHEGGHVLTDTVEREDALRGQEVGFAVKRILGRLREGE